MKTLIKRLSFGTLILSALCFTSLEAHARLPKPIQIHATILYIDHETQTVVAKADKAQKPFVLDWNKETEFIRNGQATTATSIKEGTSLVIHCQRLSFRNPLLKKVIWSDGQTQAKERP